MCTLDLTKAFDVMNHHQGLFIKVTERALPEKVLENWFNIGVAYMKQGNTYSLTFFVLTHGIHQLGGVLSPYLFAVFIDSVVQYLQASGVGCYAKFVCISLLSVQVTSCC